MNSGFGRSPCLRNPSSIPPSLWEVWASTSARACRWTMQCSAYFPKAHAELSRRVKSNVLPHLSRDVIVFSHTEEEHLHRMRVIFDRLREHGLKLKPSKCEVFKTEINYLAHHVSKKGVQPSKKNLESIAECPPPDTYTKVKSSLALSGTTGDL